MRLRECLRLHICHSQSQPVERQRYLSLTVTARTATTSSVDHSLSQPYSDNVICRSLTVTAAQRQRHLSLTVKARTATTLSVTLTHCHSPYSDNVICHSLSQPHSDNVICHSLSRPVQRERHLPLTVTARTATTLSVTHCHSRTATRSYVTHCHSRTATTSSVTHCHSRISTTSYVTHCHSRKATTLSRRV